MNNLFLNKIETKCNFLIYRIIKNNNIFLIILDEC